MKRTAISILLIAVIHLIGFAQQINVPVFISGAEGYKTFRIPAIIGLKDGTLLAFCEGRVNGAADFGDIKIVLKRSTDHGKTWSPLQTIVDNDRLQAGNPAPVIDLTDPAYPRGRIFLFYNTGNNSESQVRKGKGLREVWYKTSTDAGVTWSPAVNITGQVHHPMQTETNPAYNDRLDWRSYANTPGHAIQLQNEKYRGRIYIIANHSAGDAQNKFTDYDVHGYYSDDHGSTFHLSHNLDIPGSNESMAVELSDGRLMINTRNQTGNPGLRIVAISSNGGEKWDKVYYDSLLHDPVCQGSILNIHLKKNRSALAFCNDDETKKRNNLTLRISNTDGADWPVKFIVDKSADDYKGDFTAYSDLVQISKNKIGVLYERDSYKQIVFKLINIKK